MNTTKVAYRINSSTVDAFKMVCDIQGLVPTRVIHAFMDSFIKEELVWYSGKPISPENVRELADGTIKMAHNAATKVVHDVYKDIPEASGSSKPVGRPRKQDENSLLIEKAGLPSSHNFLGDK